MVRIENMLIRLESICLIKVETNGLVGHKSLKVFFEGGQYIDLTFTDGLKLLEAMKGDSQVNVHKNDIDYLINKPRTKEE